MKTITIFFMTAIMSSSLMAQTDQESAEQTIAQFVNATDTRDVHGIFYLAHEKFQGILLLQDSKVNSVVSKGDYMKLLAEKKLGGEEQKVEISDLEIVQHMVSAKVRITKNVSALDFIYYLYRDGMGWQVIYVLPYQTQKI